MSSRDRRLAETRYAGRQSASEKARAAKGGTESSRAAMQRVIVQPRSQESLDRAAKHKGNLPPLG